MNRLFPKSLVLIAALLVSTVGSFAQEDAAAKPELSDAEKAKIIKDTVALGRAHMGGEAKLDAIQAIRFKGVLVYGNGQSGTVESVFKKPNYHQFTSTIGGNKETSTLNPTAAWQMMENVQSPDAYTLNFYEVDDMRHLQATIVDTFSFLKTPPTRNGRIEYLGKGKVDGKSAIVLAYVHSDTIWFRRYFDPETGRVMHMVNSKGIVYTYEGELEANGVKFPKKTIVRFVTQFGEQSMEISYASAETNIDIDMERFKVPQPVIE